MLFLNLLAAALTGVLSGFGVGGGTLLLLYLQYVGGLAQYAAQAVNLAYFIPAALAALPYHIRAKRIVWKAAVPAALAGTAAALLCAGWAGVMDTTLLRRLFGGLLIYVGIREIFTRAKRPDSSVK